ncbi:MAG: DUF84 family protein [Acidobacteria bacterium]|nr:DUF84 family protein [Acidobacteriota bacterium]MBI3658321.1 DUF84 family protein [Acidobacteriota bacterium]
MIVVVGSVRGPKVRAVERFVELFGSRLQADSDIRIMTMEAVSGVRETPIRRVEIMQGARRRAEVCLARADELADPRVFGVGLEGGLTSSMNRTSKGYADMSFSKIGLT